MAMLTIRNIPEETLHALRARADRNGQSMEAEVLQILDAAVRPVKPVKLGSLLAEIGRQARLNDDEFAVFSQIRACPSKLH